MYLLICDGYMYHLQLKCKNVRTFVDVLYKKQYISSLNVDLFLGHYFKVKLQYENIPFNHKIAKISSMTYFEINETVALENSDMIWDAVLLIYKLTSKFKENATSKYTSICKGYIEYTSTEDFWWFREYNRYARYWQLVWREISECLYACAHSNRS